MEECDDIVEVMGIFYIFFEWFGVNIVISGFFVLMLFKEGNRIIFLSGVFLLCEGENDLCI